jgi:hypothetical protein
MSLVFKLFAAIFSYSQLSSHVRRPRKLAINDAGSPPVKVRLLTTADLDRRTKASQVALETKDAIMSDLGGKDQLSTLERLMAENAAFSSTVLRDAHVRWLRGEPVSVAELATLENTFNRTAQALGLVRRSRDVTPSLTEYIDMKANKETSTDDDCDSIPTSPRKATRRAPGRRQGHQAATHPRAGTTGEEEEGDSMTTEIKEIDIHDE